MIHFTIKKVLKEKAFKIFTAFLMISFYLNLCFFWLCSMGDDKFIGGLVFFYFCVVGVVLKEHHVVVRFIEMVSAFFLFIVLICSTDFNFDLDKFLTLNKTAVLLILFLYLTIIALIYLYLFKTKIKISSGNGLLKLYKDKGNLFFVNNELSYTDLDKNLTKNFDIRSLGVAPCK
jgi:hypothetical protein